MKQKLMLPVSVVDPDPYREIENLSGTDPGSEKNNDQKYNNIILFLKI